MIYERVTKAKQWHRWAMPERGMHGQMEANPCGLAGLHLSKLTRGSDAQSYEDVLRAHGITSTEAIQVMEALSIIAGMVHRQGYRFQINFWSKRDDGYAQVVAFARRPPYHFVYAMSLGYPAVRNDSDGTSKDVQMSWDSPGQRAHVFNIRKLVGITKLLPLAQTAYWDRWERIP